MGGYDRNPRDAVDAVVAVAEHWVDGTLEVRVDYDLQWHIYNVCNYCSTIHSHRIGLTISMRLRSPGGVHGSSMRYAASSLHTSLGVSNTMHRIWGDGMV